MATDTTRAEDERIGNYRYVHTIYAGPNTTIYEVSQEGTGKRFALKQLLPGKAEDPENRKQFAAEARLGMLFQHPNLIRTHEFIKDKTAPYYVMDYFPSSHLKQVLRTAEKAEWLRSKLGRALDQTMQALAYMHDKGYVHRDIKPENIIVNPAGEVRVIDPALAKPVPRGIGRLFAGKPPREGTLSYMAPEQIQRERPAVAADIYSLGCTCYELASGRPPFRANSANELLNKHLREKPVALSSHNPDVTPEFTELVMQMLAKLPAQRPSNLHEVRSRLGRMRIFKDRPVSG